MTAEGERGQPCVQCVGSAGVSSLIVNAAGGNGECGVRPDLGVPWSRGARYCGLPRMGSNGAALPFWSKFQ